MLDVVALGDVNVDIIAHFTVYPDKGADALASTTEIHCGGSAANTAMALARMGLKTSLIARVGPDSWALKVYRCLNDAGVSPSGLQRDPAAMTGLMYVVVTPDGERTILGHRGANVLTEAAKIPQDEICTARLLHLSGYALLDEPQRGAALLALEIARRHGLAVSVDPGMSIPDGSLGEMQALLVEVHILLPSLAEARHLTNQSTPEACVQALLEAGARVVALKLGREGCLVGHDGEFFRVPGFTVEARDSTGAGDSFDAGIIAGYLGGLDWQSSAVLGNAMGAMAAANVGAATVAPRAQEVQDLLRRHHQAPTHRDCLGAIERVIEFVSSLSREPEEEGKPWWT
jgi:ribokinase